MRYHVNHIANRMIVNILDEQHWKYEEKNMNYVRCILQTNNKISCCITRNIINQRVKYYAKRIKQKAVKIEKYP